MKILAGILCLGLIWLICGMIYAPYMDDEGHIIDPNNENDNLF
ncbi:hypothetical protein UFOVP153_25 [uncultured Caudovirales phage]|uniref:Uncharacterized protein n=1 Tax=uncultured Caudovirales phage TaxID=2100421 RepID=A0A6J5KZ86_9CAUD|nr:hypothetical protein UFOVP69_33 [uncultured Caudovirales phage]CAB5170513.1 hypothetical protein UFOVP153_25 [uncultured Caudovirales phage]